MEGSTCSLTTSSRGNRHFSFRKGTTLKKAAAPALFAAQPQSAWVALLEDRERWAKFGTFWKENYSLAGQGSNGVWALLFICRCLFFLRLQGVRSADGWPQVPPPESPPATSSESLFRTNGLQGDHFEAFASALVAAGSGGSVPALIERFTQHWQDVPGYSRFGNAAYRAGRLDLAEHWFAKIATGGEYRHQEAEMSLLAEIWQRRGEIDKARETLVDCLHKLAAEARSAKYEGTLLRATEQYKAQRGTYLRLFPDGAAELEAKGLPENPTISPGQLRPCRSSICAAFRLASFDLMPQLRVSSQGRALKLIPASTLPDRLRRCRDYRFQFAVNFKPTIDNNKRMRKKLRPVFSGSPRRTIPKTTAPNVPIPTQTA